MTFQTMLPGGAFFLLQGASQPSGFTLFLPLILIMVIFYFLMIMPAQRRQKKVSQMLEESEERRQGHYQRRHLRHDRRPRRRRHPAAHRRTSENQGFSQRHCRTSGRTEGELARGMSSQLKWKFVFIAIVILVCLFGIFGMNQDGPSFPTSLAALKQNLADRINLGLDLKGGSHLVLQVQVDEAIGQRCDQAIDQLRKQLHDKNINFGEIRRVDDTHILVRDVDPATSGTFRDLINNQFTDWAISPAAGEQNGYLLTMKPSVVADFRKDAMDQSLETITRRINALGLTEPTIAFTGRADDEILVQLPGEGDPTRAKAVIQAGGQLAVESRRRRPNLSFAS